MNSILNSVLICMAIVCAAVVSRNFLSQGWLSIHDIYLLAGGATLIIASLLPKVLKVNILVLIAILLLSEASFHSINKFLKPDIKETRTTEPPGGKYRIDDPILGYKPVANMTSWHTKAVQGKQIFRVRYAIDQYGRRITPQENTGCRDQYLLFFGGSQTFGFGLNENETLPYYVANSSPTFRTYNYAYGGYGPQHMLARLQETPIRDEISEREGMAIYLFVDDHIRRVINTMRTRWVHRSPYYVFEDNGELARLGNFNTARPYLYRLYHDLLLKSATLDFFHMDFPLAITEEDIDTSTKIIERAYQTYKKKFKNDKFYVVIHFNQASQFGGKLESKLSKLGISVLYYEKSIPLKEEFQIYRPYETHTSAKGNKVLAERLVADLAIDRGCSALLEH